MNKTSWCLTLPRYILNTEWVKSLFEPDTENMQGLLTQPVFALPCPGSNGDMQTRPGHLVYSDIYYRDILLLLYRYSTIFGLF